jgi:hypothetical protein
MPVLQFFVGAPEVIAGAQEAITLGTLGLLLPGEGAQAGVGSPVEFSWLAIPGAVAYRLELRGAAGAVLNAAVGAGESSYTSPPWALKEENAELMWRVVAMDAKARVKARSVWRKLQTRPAAPGPPAGADAGPASFQSSLQGDHGGEGGRFLIFPPGWTY